MQNSDKVREEVDRIMRNRLVNRLGRLNDFISMVLPPNFYIAGGIFQKRYVDYDFYLKSVSDYERVKEQTKGSSNIVFETDSAITFNYNKATIQICNYYRNNIQELCESFDYSHCQIGAEVINQQPATTEDSQDRKLDLEVVQLYMSDAFLISMIANSIKYMDSEYPLSSLIRAFKFYKRGLMPKSRLVQDVMVMMRQIIERGYSSFDDFETQLQGISGNIARTPAAVEFFNLLNKGEPYVPMEEDDNISF